MEDPSIFGDEVIADSEGEDDSFIPLKRARIAGNDSTVSQFTENRTLNDSVTNFTPCIATKVSTIENASSSSAGPSAPSRPRPKPAYKGAAGFQGDSSISNESRSTPPSRVEDNTMLLDFAIPSIADRAKMRRRDNKSSPRPTFSEFTPPPPPLPPSKSNSRKTSPIEVLELTDSDDDELALAPASTKKKSATAKPKAKPRKSPVKRTRVVHSPPPDSSQPSLPIATSPILPPVPLPGSTLPPSDPPLPTPLEHPPIAVLPKLTIEQGSSSRATSPCPSGKRKRSSERDELEGDDVSMDVDKQSMPPPQTADTSSSKKTKKTKEKKKPTVSVEIESKKAKGKKVTKEKTPLNKGKGKAKEAEVAQSAEIVYDDDDLFGDGRPETIPMGAGPSTSSSSDRRQVSSETSARPNPPEDGEEREPPQKRQKTDTNTKKNSSKKKRSQKVVMSEEEEDGKPEEAEKVKSAKKNGSSKKTKTKASKDSHDQDGPADHHSSEISVDTLPKENVNPSPVAPAPVIPQTIATETPSKPANPSISSRYTIAPRTKSTPMSELIRRANAQPGSPFYSPTTSSAKPSAAGTTYSPYMKSSRSMLSRIAPLHPNRRTPPPPPPPPPPRKKSKKELELEEKWEEELVESVGGLTEWAALPEQERKDMRRMKREKEMYGYED
ncbi:hypothetical protein PM082_015896 [Marasmius tenuissimus]|nr:hypothetical protein PM082_015896 [Marasmius tenuissimus]